MIWQMCTGGLWTHLAFNINHYTNASSGWETLYFPTANLPCGICGLYPLLWERDYLESASPSLLICDYTRGDTQNQIMCCLSAVNFKCIDCHLWPLVSRSEHLMNKEKEGPVNPKPMILHRLLCLSSCPQLTKALVSLSFHGDLWLYDCD